MSTLPLWQGITGLTPEREPNLKPDERDHAIRRLLAEVDTRARAEFERGATVPAGERTVFWDPLERICKQLGISRVKLSSYARELTGLRAYELTDRIKAQTLPEQIRARLEQWLPRSLEIKVYGRNPRDFEDSRRRAEIAQELTDNARKRRSGIFAPGYALELGFANPSRLRRACLLAHRIGLDELEADVIMNMVQKFLKGLAAKAPAEQVTPAAQKPTPARTPIKEGMARKERVKAAPPAPVSPETQEIIDDAVRHVLRKRVASVA